MFQNVDPQTQVLYASLATGLTVTTLGWATLNLLSIARPDKNALGVFEYLRRQRLRQGSFIYRWFEPLIDYFARQPATGKEKAYARLARSLVLTGNPLPWKPQEYIAAKQVEGAFCSVALFVVFFAVTESLTIGLIAAALCLFGYGSLARTSVEKKADLKLKSIRQRLPFVIDLIALTMEAGASFIEALQIAVKENARHPLGEQFAEVLRDISVGRTPREALESLQARLADESASELIFAIIKGEELGTPLSQILRNQAEQMRLKRSQWAEKAAAEAQVNIVFPGLVIMVACLLVVVAPFVMAALYSVR